MAANVERQLAEVEALRSIYSGQGEFESDLGDYCSRASFTIHLNSSISVHFIFPENYPESEAVKVNVRCHGEFGRKQHETLSLAASSIAQSSIGEESTLQILQKIQELIEEEADQMPVPKLPTVFAGTPQLLKRKLFWFHHIKSTKKRKCIVEWGKELHVGGYCKPGFPGLLIIEAEDSNITEYVKRVKKLRWQAMNLRALEEEQCTDDQSIEDLRRFKNDWVEELGETDMSEFASLCREAGLEHMFLTALKLTTGGG